MNPYEANPSNIPKTDPYFDLPFYGRYWPQKNDFKPDQNHFNSTSPASLKYWASVLELCDASTILFENPWGGRDVFAVGSMIIKSCHRKERDARDFSFADANEVEAAALARTTLHDLGVKVPDVYFAGKINNHSILIQERIPGVSLSVAWTYLSLVQKTAFKEQARALLQQLHKIKAPADYEGHSYIVPDPDPLRNHNIHGPERDILFSPSNNDIDCGFAHNDCQPSNLIVNNDKIVGLVDWEMAGYFDWKTAEQVHLQIRMPNKETFANAGFTKDKLDDMLFWNDLYSDGVDA